METASATTIEVHGLRDASSVIRAASALDRHPGVIGVVIDVTTCRARVTYDALLTTSSQLVAALAEAGFAALPANRDHERGADAAILSSV